MRRWKISKREAPPERWIEGPLCERVEVVAVDDLLSDEAVERVSRALHATMPSARRRPVGRRSRYRARKALRAALGMEDEG